MQGQSGCTLARTPLGTGHRKSLNRQAYELNDRVGGECCPTAIREMLKNELYIGNVVWNPSKFVEASPAERPHRDG